MQEFLELIFENWWGIFAFCVVSLLLLFLISSLLYRQFFKRFYDFLFSFLAIVFLSPTLVVLLIVGRIKMKGSPVFCQLRPGKINKRTGKEKIFKLYKFRTMTNEKDENGNLLPDDKRLTKYGKFLRSTSLDELPSLFNILAGQISIVGPRPQLVKDMVFMTDEQRKRHLVRPGLTGLAQVNGRNVISWEKKFEYDLKYIEKISLMGDIKIILLTVKRVLQRVDICRAGTESDVDFGDMLLQKHIITVEDYDQKQGEALKLVQK